MSTGIFSKRLIWIILIGFSLVVVAAVGYSLSANSNTKSATAVLDDPTNSNVTVIDSGLGDAVIDEDAILDTKESLAYAAALADPRVSIYTTNAFNIHYNFLATELSGADVDVVTLRVVEEQTVTGDWTTSQERIYSGVHDIKIELSDGVVRDVFVTPVEDKKQTVVFSEAEKVIIGKVMDDTKIKQLIGGRDNVYVFSIYGDTYIDLENSPCKPGSCWLVSLGQANNKNTLVAWISTDTDQVVRVKLFGW